MGKSLKDRILEYVGSLPDGKFLIETDNPAELHVQLAIAMGSKDLADKIFETYKVELRAGRLRLLFDGERHAIGLEAIRAGREVVSTSFRRRADDPEHVVLTKCVQALRQEDRKARDTFEVISELVGPAEELGSALAKLRKLGFYTWAGQQRKKYRILDATRTEVTAKELEAAQPPRRPPAKASAPTFKPAAAKVPSAKPADTANVPGAKATPRARAPKATAQKEAKPAAQPERQPLQIIEQLATRLEQAQQQIAELTNQLEQTRADHANELAALRQLHEQAQQQLQQYEANSQLPESLKTRLSRLIGLPGKSSS